MIKKIRVIYHKNNKMQHLKKSLGCSSDVQDLNATLLPQSLFLLGKTCCTYDVRLTI